MVKFQRLSSAYSPGGFLLTTIASLDSRRAGGVPARSGARLVVVGEVVATLNSITLGVRNLNILSSFLAPIPTQIPTLKSP